VLFVGHTAADVGLIGVALRAAGLEFAGVAVDGRAAFELGLECQPPDLILSGYGMPGLDAREGLEMARHTAPGVPLIFVTGPLDEEVAVGLLEAGATDCILKTRLGRLAPSVRRALREARERRGREHLEGKLRGSLEQLRALTNHLQAVREEERTRIARQVHDDLGQALTALKLDLAWLNGRLRGARGLRHKVAGMLAHVDATIATVRAIATDLRPGVLDNLGLAAAIEWQAGDFQRRTGIVCAVSGALPEMPLATGLRTACFRIFQEALTNIIRHANATRVAVRLAHSEGFLVLTVRDDGRGISESEVNARSIGLIGMKERAAQVGGDVFFFGLPAQGTTVTMRLPLPADAALPGAVPR
jgi:signal transduction histidine kinase